MDSRSEEDIRNEIYEIVSIPYRDRTTEDKQRLLELHRRHPERNVQPACSVKKELISSGCFLLYSFNC